MQRKTDNLPEEIKKATRSMKDEHERLMRQEKRASASAQEDVKKKCQVRKVTFICHKSTLSPDMCVISYDNLLNILVD